MINIILFEPEIPNNTGNIIRTCLAINAKLHIIKPISFQIIPKFLKRASAGRYLSDIQHEIHENINDFLKKHGHKNILFITRYGQKTYSDYNFNKEWDEQQEIFIMFGRESTGISKKLLKDNFDKCLRIPMAKNTRSLNLANTVAILGYEIQRQLSFIGLSEFESEKSKDWILL